MSSGDWRDQWEQHGDREREKLDRMSGGELCARVEAGQWGDYYQIWPALATRATLAEAGWILFAVIESASDMLPRYHAATALLELLGESRWTEAELAAEHGREKHLPQLAAVLEQRIGPRR